MPVYCYRDRRGKLYEIPMSVKEMLRKQRKDGTIRWKGKVLKRDMVAEMKGFKNSPGAWPLYSDAAGVAPDQVKEAYEHSVRIGIPTEFTPDGRAIFRSRRHRKEYCEAIGLYDRNGGYGDPQRKGKAWREMNG